MTTFDRKVFFDCVRENPFPGSLTQQQCDGMEYVLSAFEKYVPGDDPRWLANFLAQSYHETAQAMWPVEEYQGASQPYGQVDPETGQRYYGRGLIQVTHRENYARADRELGLSGAASCEWHADNMLKPEISARAGYTGMWEGWFRSSGGTPNTFAKYFNATTDDPYMAREIVNGDRQTIPSWSNGVSIGNLIKGYHEAFLAALTAASVEEPEPKPKPKPKPKPEPVDIVLTIRIKATGPVTLILEED